MCSKKTRAEIWHIHQSSFVVRTNNHCLLFDYGQDPSSQKENTTSILELLGIDTPDRWNTTIFVSHSHPDHFNPVIFDWRRYFHDLAYVVSYDIELERERGEGMTIVRPGDRTRVHDLEIQVFDSTDIGVSFLLNCHGLQIFHAGDLNWWHWKGESDQENRAMAREYREEIDRLKGREIDLAFIPVDPRLEEYYNLGITYFMQFVGARKVFPMHFGEDYSIIKRLLEDPSFEYKEHIVPLSSKEKYFLYEKR